MYSRIMTASLLGLDCEKVWAEADVENGLQSFSIVGLANQSIKESKERVRSAILNCGMEFPDTRITINLTSAGMRKEGSHFDLAIATSVLIAGSCLTNYNSDFINEAAFLGELTLDGKIDPISGLLPMVIGLSKLGVRKIIIPTGNIHEASLVKGVEFYPVSHLLQVVDLLSNVDIPKPFLSTSLPNDCIKNDEDFSDILGQESIKRAAEIAAAGFHGMLIVGPPGVGKSMVGKRIPGIMPELNYKEQLEVTQIYSIAGLLSEEHPIILDRPFRSPHHNMSSVAMVGGGKNPSPGEVSLAHNGVLFLDELPEFNSNVLETLRQPLEDGKVTIVRASGKCTFPSRFMLVAAMNPCRCGYYGDLHHRCTCTQTDRQKYMSKISGPLLDRIDLHISAQRPMYDELNSGSKIGLDTKSMRKAVTAATLIQRERYKNLDIDFNSSLSPSQIKKYCKLDKASSDFLQEAFEKWHLSARSYHKIIKLARTIADLDESDNISSNHILEAFSYRFPDNVFK